jgi:hypothetical protein
MANLPQVIECCESSHTPGAYVELCCEFKRLAEEGISNATVEIVAEKMVKDREEEKVVKDTEVENVIKQAPIVGVKSSENLDEVVTKMPENVPLKEKYDEALAFLNMLMIKQTLLDMKPNDKQLVKAFYATKEAGLSSSMSCLAKCESECESELGGEQCQPIQTKEDCERGAIDHLGKTFVPLISQRDKERYPAGCFAIRDEPHRARWNEPTLQKPTIKISNICGCYK